MRNLLILLLLLFFQSCGLAPFDSIVHKKGKSPTPPVTDSSFPKYIALFERDFAVSVKVPIIFKENSTGAAAVCKKWSNGYHEVNVSKKYWDRINDLQREQLVYHELGHCVLNLGHNNTITIMSGINCPMSIMRSRAFNTWEIINCYEYDRGHYIQEMM